MGAGQPEPAPQPPHFRRHRAVRCPANRSAAEKASKILLPIHGPSFRWRGHRRRSLSGIAGELLELLDKLAGGWAIGRIVAAVRVHESPIGRENEVAAELQHVFPGLALVRTPAGDDETQVADQHAAAQEHGPLAAVESKVAVRGPIRIAHGRQRQRHGGHRLRSRLRDDQHVGAGLSDIVETFPHLAEMRQAGDSVEMAEEHEQQAPGIIRKADGGAVGAEKGEIGYGIADLEWHD